MNQKELDQKRRENMNKLETGYRSNVNRIEIDLSNSIWHEDAKFISFWLLRQGVPAEALPDIVPQLVKDFCAIEMVLGKIINKKTRELLRKKSWLRPVVVTEGRMKDGSRHDIFVVDTGETVEIVKSSSPKKRKDENRIEVVI